MFTQIRGLVTSTALLLFLHLSANAQSDFTVAGGDALSNSGHVSYSLGQVSYQCFFTQGGNLSLGVQQTFGTSIPLSSKSVDNSVEISLYPNPTRDEVHLVWADQVLPDTRAILYDLYGRELIQIYLKSKDETLRLSQLPTSIYFVKIFQRDVEIETFKLIKS